MEKAITTGVLVGMICLSIGIGFFVGRTAPTLSAFGYSIPACSIKW